MKKIFLMLVVVCLVSSAVPSFARNYHHHHHHHHYYHNNYCNYNYNCYCRDRDRFYQLMIALPFAMAIGQSINNSLFPKSDSNSRTHYQTNEVRYFEDGRLVGTTTTETINSEKIDDGYYHR